MVKRVLGFYPTSNVEPAGAFRRLKMLFGEAMLSREIVERTEENTTHHRQVLCRDRLSQSDALECGTCHE